jgi:hypothetical protein
VKVDHTAKKLKKASKVYLEGARKIAEGFPHGVVMATAGTGSPYEKRLREYFGADVGWPWEVDELNAKEQDKLRVLALCFMAAIMEYEESTSPHLEQRSPPRDSLTVDMTDPATRQPGANGYRVRYTKAGDLVEWIPDEERPGKEWPMLLRRNDKAIAKAYHEFWDKVWWSRHQFSVQALKRGERQLTEAEKPHFKKGKKAAKRIEKKYGRKNLPLDDFELGILNGKLSALAWVLGSDWEDSMST